MKKDAEKGVKECFAKVDERIRRLSEGHEDYYGEIGINTHKRSGSEIIFAYTRFVDTRKRDVSVNRVINNLYLLQDEMEIAHEKFLRFLYILI